MGSVIGSLIGSCVGSCAIGAVCTACSCKCIFSPGGASLFYVALITLTAITAVSMRYGGVDLNVGFSVGVTGPSVCVGNSTECDSSAFSFSICNSENCQGYWAVYRIAFTLAAFFACMAILTSCRSQFSAYLHRGFWIGKVLILICAFVGSLFASNDLFASCAWIARFIAPLFMIYQLIILIDCGYSTNTWLIEKDEREDVFCGLSNNGFKYHGVILVLAALFYVFAIGLIVFMFAWWPMGACAFNPLAVITTLLFGVLNTVVSLSKIAPHGSILCSGLIFAYQAFICYMSLTSFPDDVCNPNVIQGDGLMLLVSCLVAGITCGYFAYRGGSQAIGGNAMKGGASKAPAIELTSMGASPVPTTAAHDQVTVQVEGGSSSGEIPVESQGFFAYHLTMFLICNYMAMLFTDWGVPGGVATTLYSVGYVAAWLQMSTNWLCGLLYLWTLIAPTLLPDRDFS